MLHGGSVPEAEEYGLAAEQLLQCALTAGFTVGNVRQLAKQTVVTWVTPSRLRATLHQLQALGHMTEQQAVYVLGRDSKLLSFKPERFSVRLSNVRHLTGMSSAQADTMIQGSMQLLMISSDRVSAVIDTLSGLGYSKDDICKLLRLEPASFQANLQTTVDKHAQLAALFGATPEEVRTFVLKRPRILRVNLNSAADKIQLWQEETGRPPNSVLKVPALFTVSLGRTAARLCFLHERGHSLTKAAGVLWQPFAYFSHNLSVSESEYAAWREDWLTTPKGQRYGDATSKF